MDVELVISLWTEAEEELASRSAKQPSNPKTHALGESEAAYSRLFEIGAFVLVNEVQTRLIALMGDLPADVISFGQGRFVKVRTKQSLAQLLDVSRLELANDIVKAEKLNVGFRLGTAVGITEAQIAEARGIPLSPWDYDRYKNMHEHSFVETWKAAEAFGDAGKIMQLAATLARSYDDLEDKRKRLQKLNEIARFVRSASTDTEEVRDRTRGPIPESVRHEVWRRDEAKCVTCGSKDKLEFDHVIPVSKGGSNTARNLQLLCEACNRRKSDII